MINIVVKKDGEVISKDAFGGDDEASRQLIEKMKLANPNLVYEEVASADFAQVEQKTSGEKGWADMKTVDEKISFLAKQLGLE